MVETRLFISVGITRGHYRFIQQFHIQRWGRWRSIRMKVIHPLCYPLPHLEVSQSAAAPAVSVPPARSDMDVGRKRIFFWCCCGHNSPLPSALRAIGGDVVKFDILLRTQDGLLDATAFSRLLKLAASGLVAYYACSPACCQYSRLKLRPGGPPALRTPDHLDGVPGLSSWWLSQGPGQ